MKRSRVCAISTGMIESLAKLQDALNKFIDVDWRTKRQPDDWGLAVTIEATELMDSYPWKWWKNVNATPDFNNVKVELVDILHFALSGTMQMSGKPQQAIPEDVLSTIVPPLAETANAVKTFRNVIYLAKIHRFDVITEMVIASADDLEFNLVGYYIAKHTLNYIRQLGGYKSGAYKKVRDGVEDNALLHECLAQVPVEETLDDTKYVEAWDKIMALVYDAFNVDHANRRKTADWL